MSDHQEKYYNQIDAYLRDELSEGDRVLFERALQENSELYQNFIIHKELFVQFDDSLWIENNIDFKDEDLKELNTYFKSNEVEHLKNTINKAQDKYKKKQNNKGLSRQGIIISIVAAASIAFAVILYNYNPDQSPTDLYTVYSEWNNLPSLTSRNESDLLSKGQFLFEEGNYIEANKVFKSYYDSNKNRTPSVLIYLGISNLELNNYEEAISYFDELIKANVIDSSRGYWYKVLVYLKKDERNKAKSILEMISGDKNNFNYKEAKVLLDKLK